MARERYVRATMESIVFQITTPTFSKSINPSVTVFLQV